MSAEPVTGLDLIPNSGKVLIQGLDTRRCLRPIARVIADLDLSSFSVAPELLTGNAHDKIPDAIPIDIMELYLDLTL